MVKCSQDQVKRLKKALQREKDPAVRQRIQMILLREDGKTRPEIAELTSPASHRVGPSHPVATSVQGGRPMATNSSWLRRGKRRGSLISVDRPRSDSLEMGSAPTTASHHLRQVRAPGTDWSLRLPERFRGQYALISSDQSNSRQLSHLCPEGSSLEQSRQSQP